MPLGLVFVLGSLLVELCDGAVLRTAASMPFEAFISLHRRTLPRGSKEYELRKAIFNRRIEEADAHNNRPRRLWTAGVSWLYDRTDEELSQLRGWRGGASPKASGKIVGRTSKMSLRQSSKLVLPQEKSWAHLNWSKRQFDQGGCGSCWAAATATILNQHHEIHFPESKRSFSPQHLVNCVPNPQHCGGKGGCQGATVEMALDYALKHGCPSDEEVPYVGIDGVCNVPGGGKSLLENELIQGSRLMDQGKYLVGNSFGMRGWEKLPENEHQPLLRALVERGPVGVSAAASTWNLYSSGIFDGCKDFVIDHAVTLIGYGKDVEKYWLVKNSWGGQWGENGNIRLLRRDDDDEQCGTDMQPEDGTGCDGGPKEVKVCGMCGILYDSSLPHMANSTA